MDKNGFLRKKWEMWENVILHYEGGIETINTPN